MAVFLFPFVAGAAVGAVAALTGGGTAAGTYAATHIHHSKRGHKPGEGACTPRDSGYPGVLVSPSSTSDLGQFLAALVAGYPNSGLAAFGGKLLEITESEGEELRAMTQPIKTLSEKRLEAAEQLDELAALAKAGNEEAQQVFGAVRASYQELCDLIEQAIRPVIVYLQNFPKARVK